MLNPLLFSIFRKRNLPVKSKNCQKFVDVMKEVFGITCTVFFLCSNVVMISSSQVVLPLLKNCFSETLRC